MLQLDDWHPDLLRFIDAKRTPGMIENANISVRVSDEFMAAVKADAEWVLRFPDTRDPHYDAEWDGNLPAWEAKGYPVVEHARLRAREIWERLIESAWASAEPGIVFSGRHERESNSQLFNPLISTNPCITGDTLVSTDKGLIPVRALVGSGDFAVPVDRRMGGGTKAGVAAFPTGVKPVYRLTTSQGFEVRLTEDHRVLTERGWVAAKDLVHGDEINVMNGVGGFGAEGSYDLGLTLGWLVGDGQIKEDRATLHFYGDEKEALAPLFATAVNSIVRPASNNRAYTVGVVDVPTLGSARVSSKRLLEIAALHGLTENKLQVPDGVLRGTRETQIGFLRGLFSADGHVESGPESRHAVVLTSVSVPLLQGVQRLLLNLGVYSRIYRGRHAAGAKVMPDGHGGSKVYDSQERHDLRITRHSLRAFAETIGFLQADKADRLAVAAASYSRGPYREDFLATFESLTPDGTEVVYDLTVPDVHAFAANGLIVHNCAEEPLPAWGVCTLGHVNLAACIVDGKLDSRVVERAVRAGVRFLDNVIDATPYFIEEIRDNQAMERRIGLGTMGIAEVLMRLGLTYGSPEAVDFVDRLYRDIAYWAYAESIALAKEKGAFLAWDPAVLETEAFVGKMAREFPDLKRGLARYGMRNVTVLTQAPTGTTGSMIDTSTGIEPYYDIKTQRQSRVGTDLQFARPAQEWLDAHPGEELPDYFIGAKDLTPVQHIVMQATVQKWVDASISKTANAPGDYSVEQTRELYELAYELGCKGVTIYRDNSRTDQVLRSAGDGEWVGPPVTKKPVPALALRPARMRGECFLVRTHFGNLTVDVHEDPTTGEPVEIIASAGAAGSDLMADAVALGMSASVLLRLRSDVPVLERLEVIADKFRNIGGSKSGNGGLGAAASLAQGIARGLDQYLDVVRQRSQGSEAPAPSAEALSVTTEPEGHPPVQGTSATVDLCPSCGRYSMEMVEGCRTCRDCGFSKCS